MPSCAALAAQRADRAETVVQEPVKLNALAAEHLDGGSRFTDIGRQLHHEIARGCGNHTMAVVMGSLEALWTSNEHQWAEQTTAQGDYPPLAERRAAHAAHVKLTLAIEGGDAERARRLAARHAGETQTYVVADEPDQRIQAPPAQVISGRRH